MSSHKFYVCGPMTDMPAHNFPLFNRVATDLRIAGYEVVNPTEISHPNEGKCWEDCMKLDIAELMKCNAIVMLPGWSRSRGALLELMLAKILDYTICEIDVGEMVPRDIDISGSYLLVKFIGLFIVVP